MSDKEKYVPTGQYYQDGPKWRQALQEDIDNPDIFTCTNPPELVELGAGDVVVSNPELKLLNDAIMGHRGVDQARIGRVGLKWLGTLLRKNHDYESSAWEQPTFLPHLSVGDSILVRMGDKVKRIRSLRGKKNEVADENFNDTIGDLGSYCLLYLSRPEE